MKYPKFSGIVFLVLQSVFALCQPTINRIFQPPGVTGLYEKLEIGLSIDAVYANPFDPDELDIMATFRAPFGKEWKVPGFYTQSRRGGFLVRFSPDETGEWSYMVSVTDRNGTSASETKTFAVVPSVYHGPIRIAQNKRYLEQADGTPWFGVGLWYNRGDDAAVLDELQGKGVNFISRLITPLETWGTGLGRYDQMLCQEIDELLGELEKRDMQLSLNIWFHSFLSETVWGGGNIAWYTNPYQLVCEASFPINKTGQVDKDETHPLTYSYLNYHGQVRKLWNNYERPAIIPETGWDHTFYEMSMPGYQSQYHNALWVTMASGSAMSPFWWSYSDQLNDNMVTNQLRYFGRFTEQIPFSKLTGLAPLKAENPGGDAFAIGSDQLIFGWAVNAKTEIAGKTITISGVNNGQYRLKLYHTWSGRYIEVEGQEELLISAGKNSLSFTVPILRIEGGHARYTGQDVAFILEPAE